MRRVANDGDCAYRKSVCLLVPPRLFMMFDPTALFEVLSRISDFFGTIVPVLSFCVLLLKTPTLTMVNF